jgi:hypothetical protein
MREHGGTREGVNLLSLGPPVHEGATDVCATGVCESWSQPNKLEWAYDLLIRFPCVANLNSTLAAPVRPTTIVSSRGSFNFRRDYFEQTNTRCQGRKMMRLDYLSCFLTILSTVLVGKKLWQGWVVAGANSVIICVIGMRTAEFGFLPGNLFCIGLYANNLWNWRPKAQIANSRSRPQSHA